jgi:hypothetical protein
VRALPTASSDACANPVALVQEPISEPDSKSYRPRARFAPTTLEQHITAEEPYYTSASLHRELLPSSLAHSPPGRSSTLPPVPRSLKPNRPRKSSVGQNARKPKHERTKSKEHGRRMSYDRKAFSAEPQTAAAAIYGKRWEDLIDAAASATEEDSRDLTPVSIQFTPSFRYALTILRCLLHPIIHHTCSTGRPCHHSLHLNFNRTQRHLYRTH